MKLPDELKEMMLEPAKRLIDHLEWNRESLNLEETMMLEKLKFAIKMYELEKSFKMEGRS